MLLDELVPIVDPEMAHDPLRHLESAEEVLLGEGWPRDRVDEWLRITVTLSPAMLRLMASKRRN